MNNIQPPPGKTTIAPEVLITIARLTTLTVPGVSYLSNVPGGFKGLFKRGENDGVRVNVDNDIVTVDLHVVLKHDANIRDVCHDIQEEVARAISETVGMTVGFINVHVEDIDFSIEETS
ncbi:MAG: Asp23/Gls24 family envelope stress response protein [Chloroflexota bacterium]